MSQNRASLARALPVILSGAATTNPSAGAEYVNYVDVKIEGVHHLPSDWFSAGAPPSTGSASNPSSATAGGNAGGGNNAGNANASAAKDVEDGEVAFAFHPFRYEVTLSLPADATAAAPGDVQASTTGHAADANVSGPTLLSIQSPSMPEVTTAGDEATAAGANSSAVVAAFTRGRLLLPLPAYTAYIANAEAPPVRGVDDAAPMRDVPAAIDADDLRRAADSTRDDADVSGAGHNGIVAPSDGAAAAAPSLLWVVTEKTEGAALQPNNNNSFTAGNAASSASAGLVAAKRRLKMSLAPSAAAAGGATNAAVIAAASAAAAANTAALASAAAVPGAPPPPLPDASEAAPCVVRVPLTAAQEAHLDALLHSGAPLELRLHRTLRAGCPAEWEDLNAAYYEAVIPVPLTALAEPGSTRLSAQVPLQPAYLYAAGGRGSFGNAAGLLPSTAPDSAAGLGGGAAAAGGDHADRANNANNKKRNVTRKTRQTVPGLLVDEPDRGAPHPYAVAGTTAAVSLTFQRTLTRLVSDRIRPAVTPAQLIPARPTPTAAAAAADDVRVQLQRTLQDIARHLVRDVHDLALIDSSAGAASGGGVGSAAWRAQFVAALQGTGQLAAFRSRLAPLVTSLVQERLRVHPAASAEEVAAASNELYVQLMDMLHATLRESVEGGAEGLPRTGEQIEEADKDIETRCRAFEAEVSGEPELAGSFFQSRLATHTGDAASWAAVWVDCALHYQRSEDMARAEQCYREALACDVACGPALLDYGVWLLAHDRLDEAAVFLHGLVDVAPRHLLGWTCVALLADLRELAIRAGSPDAATEHAKWSREHGLALRCAVDCLHADREADGGAAVAAADAAEEAVYLHLAAYLVQLHHRDLANVCLARCRQGEPQVELIYAQLFTQGGQYAEALSALDEATAAAAAMSAEAADTCALLRAECAAALGRTAQAVTLYKQALSRGSPAVGPAYVPALAARWREDTAARRTTTAATSATLAAARTTEALCLQRVGAYLRLCNLLLAEGRYQDALGAITLAMQVWPECAVLWLGAGIAYYRAGDVVAAEACLQESNTLNPSNARTWAFLALLSLRLQHAGVEELVQQVMALNLDDAALWAELGRTLLNTSLYPKLSIACLRRAASLARGPQQPKSAGAALPSSSSSSLLTATQYHLAHALMDAQQWGEAEQLLREVASSTSGGNEVLRGRAEEELAMLHTA